MGTKNFLNSTFGNTFNNDNKNNNVNAELKPSTKTPEDGPSKTKPFKFNFNTQVEKLIKQKTSERQKQKNFNFSFNAPKLESKKQWSFTSKKTDNEQSCRNKNREQTNEVKHFCCYLAAGPSIKLSKINFNTHLENTKEGIQPQKQK
jgi:hypothetical protein